MDTKIRAQCTDVNESALLNKLTQTLDGAARDYAISYAGDQEPYTAGLAALDRKYGDTVELAMAYLFPKDTSLQALAKDVPSLLRKIEGFLPTLKEKEGIDTVPFLLQLWFLCFLPESGMKAWEEFRVKAKEDHRDKENPWKASNIWTTDDVEVFLRRHAAETKDESANVFLAGKVPTRSNPLIKKEFPADAQIPGCVICGPKAHHISAECNIAKDKTPEEWGNACRHLGLCMRCGQVKWSKAHRCRPSCSIFEREHISSRHSKPSRLRVEKGASYSSQRGTPCQESQETLLCHYSRCSTTITVASCSSSRHHCCLPSRTGPPRTKEGQQEAAAAAEGPEEGKEGKEALDVLSIRRTMPNG